MLIKYLTKPVIFENVNDKNWKWMTHIRINKYLLTDVLLTNWSDSCNSWYPKKKYKGSEVGVEYFGFNINGLDSLISSKSGIINCGINSGPTKLVRKSLDAIEFFLRFLTSVSEFESRCWSTLFCLTYEKMNSIK